MSVRKWCFTLNNPTPDDILQVNAMTHKYLVYGKEVGESGTPHLQGYIELAKASRLAAMKKLLPTAHWENAKGTPEQASAYCKKDGDFYEDGELSKSRQGKRSDLEDLRDAINEGQRDPKKLRQDFTAALKYPQMVRQLLIDTRPKPVAPAITLRPWQANVIGLLHLPPDPRKIHFFVDHLGNAGKSTFATYLEACFEGVQVMKPGRYQDMAYELDESVKIFIMDCPRSRHEVLQYNFLEDIKDGRVTNSKYESYQKRIGPTHILVFLNEAPDVTKLSLDRYDVKNLPVSL